MDHPIEEEFKSALLGTPIEEPGVVYQYQAQPGVLWVDLTNHETLDALLEAKPDSVRKLYTSAQDELAIAPLATVAAARAKLDEINAHLGRARTLPSIVDDVRGLFRVCDFEVRENSGFCELAGSIDAGGILVDAVLEHIKNLADCAALSRPASTSGDAPTDLQQLKTLALAADQGEGQHIYTNPRDSNGWKANEAWHRAASPAVVLDLIARIDQQQAGLELASETLRQAVENNDKILNRIARIDNALDLLSELDHPAASPATASGDERPDNLDYLLEYIPVGAARHEAKRKIEEWVRAAVSAATKPTAEEETLRQVCDMLHIGFAARTPSTILTNVGNLIRRGECLNAIEREFFTVETDPPADDEEPGEECLLNWGATATEYVKQFREALAATKPAAAPAVPEGWAQYKRELLGAAFDLTSKLTALHTVMGEGAHELIRREDAMELVTQWRARVDAANRAFGKLAAAPVAQDQAKAETVIPAPSQITDADSARSYIAEWHREHFPTDRTFTNYIMGHNRHCALAGDFAWQLAKALEAMEAAPIARQAQPTDRDAVLEEAAMVCENEVPCSCCFSEDEVVLAANLAAAIRALKSGSTPAAGAEGAAHG
jgi:hypothetical protein